MVRAGVQVRAVVRVVRPLDRTNYSVQRAIPFYLHFNFTRACLKTGIREPSISKPSCLSAKSAHYAMVLLVLLGMTGSLRLYLPAHRPFTALIPWHLDILAQGINESLARDLGLGAKASECLFPRRGPAQLRGGRGGLI